MVVVELARLAQRAGGVLEEAGQALQRHVLERRGGAVEELEHVRAAAQGHHRRDAGVVPLVAVGARHERRDVGGRHVDAERVIDAGGALRVGERGQAADLAEREGGDRRGARTDRRPGRCPARWPRRTRAPR